MRLLNEMLLNSQKDFDLFNHSILLGYMGSISHGTYIPNDIDDKDVMGVVIPPISYYFGLKEFGSRSTKVLKQQYWDVVIYEIKKFFNLLLKNNPNVLGLLWLPDNLYIRKTEVGELLVKKRDIFSSQIAYHSFCGYAYSQLQKLERGVSQGYMGEKRKQLLIKYGFDLKNASHLIRLLSMGCEFVKTGQVNVYREDKSKLIEIKKGLWSLDKVKREAEQLFKDFKILKEKSPLPLKPDYEEINNFLCHLIRHFYTTSNL